MYTAAIGCPYIFSASSMDYRNPQLFADP